MNFDKIIINVQNRFFQPIEVILRRLLTYEDVHPIWIIGSPRSGTTLTYQLLCKSIEASYLTNRVANRYKIALLTRIFERTFKKKSLEPDSYKSDFGRTKSNSDPHEGGQFFYQFYSFENQYSDKESLELSKKKSFKRIINAIAFPSKLFISKNTVHSLRIKSLMEIFPNSSFLWVTRDKLDLIHSISQSYLKNKVQKDEWWGARVPDWEKYTSKAIEEKALFQSNQIDDIIKNDLKSTKANYCKVSYKELCEDPKRVISEISDKLKLNDFLKDLEKEVPDSFECSRAPKDELANKIKDLLKRSEQ